MKDFEPFAVFPLSLGSATPVSDTGYIPPEIGVYIPISGRDRCRDKREHLAKDFFLIAKARIWP